MPERNLKKLSKKQLDELMKQFEKTLPNQSHRVAWMPGHSPLWYTCACTAAGNECSCGGPGVGSDVTLLDLPNYGSVDYDLWMHALYAAAPDVIRTAIVRERSVTMGHRWKVVSSASNPSDPATCYYHRVFSESGLLEIIAEARMNARIYTTGGVIRLLREDVHHPIHGLESLDPRFCLSTGNPDVPIVHYIVDEDGSVTPEPLYWWEVIRIVDGELTDEAPYPGGMRLSRPAILDLHRTITNGAALDRVIGAEAGNGHLARIMFLYGIDRESFMQVIDDARSEHGRYGTELPGAIQLYNVPYQATTEGDVIKPSIEEFKLQSWPTGIPTYIEISRDMATKVQARLMQPLNLIYTGVYGDAALSHSQVRMYESKEHGDPLARWVIHAINEIGIEHIPGQPGVTLELDQIASEVDEVRSLIEQREAQTAQLMVQTEVMRRQAQNPGASIAFTPEELRALYGSAYRPGMLSEYEASDRRPQPFTLTSDERPYLDVDITAYVDNVIAVRSSRRYPQRRRMSLQQDIARWRMINDIEPRLADARRLIEQARVSAAPQIIVQAEGDEREDGPESPPDDSEAAALLYDYQDALFVLLGAYQNDDLNTLARDAQIEAYERTVIIEFLMGLMEDDAEAVRDLDGERLAEAIAAWQQAEDDDNTARILLLLALMQDALTSRAADAAALIADNTTLTETARAALAEELTRNEAFLMVGLGTRLLEDGYPPPDQRLAEEEAIAANFLTGGFWALFNRVTVANAPTEQLFEFAGPADERNCGTCAAHVGQRATAAQINSGAFPIPAIDTDCGPGCRHQLIPVT